MTGTIKSKPALVGELSGKQSLSGNLGFSNNLERAYNEGYEKCKEVMTVTAEIIDGVLYVRQGV